MFFPQRADGLYSIGNGFMSERYCLGEYQDFDNTGIPREIEISRDGEYDQREEDDVAFFHISDDLAVSFKKIPTNESF